MHHRSLKFNMQLDYTYIAKYVATYYTCSYTLIGVAALHACQVKTGKAKHALRHSILVMAINELLYI